MNRTNENCKTIKFTQIGFVTLETQIDTKRKIERARVEPKDSLKIVW